MHVDIMETAALPPGSAAEPAGVIASFEQTYRRNRSEAYVLWALVRYYARHPGTPAFLSRPGWLSGQTNRLAERVREEYRRSAPIWPGNNTRFPWRGSDAHRLCTCLAHLAPPDVAQLEEAIAGYIERHEPVLDPVPVPQAVSPALIRRLLHQPTGGIYQQGVIYALAKVFYARMGWRVRTKHVSTADRRSRSWGDIEVLERGRVRLVIEVTWSRLTRRRLESAADGPPATFFVARSVPDRLREETREREFVSCFTIDEYADFLLAHLGPDPRRRAVELFADEFLRGIACGAHYGRLRGLLSG